MTFIVESIAESQTKNSSMNAIEINYNTIGLYDEIYILLNTTYDTLKSEWIKLFRIQWSLKFFTR